MSKLKDNDISKDIKSILWSMKLYKVRRYWRQKYWENENMEASYAERIEPFPRLETVGEHSWHVADIVLILCPNFTDLDLSKCLAMAILHDKLEIIMGDTNPLGRNGIGDKTYAFDEKKQKDKDKEELKALDIYLKKLTDIPAMLHKKYIEELLEKKTQEALFIKAIDKIQALAYIIIKKDGNILDQHIDFTLSYTKKSIEYFPLLAPYYFELRQIFLKSIADYRGISLEDLEKKFKYTQLSFDLV